MKTFFLIIDSFGGQYKLFGDYREAKKFKEMLEKKADEQEIEIEYKINLIHEID